MMEQLAVNSHWRDFIMNSVSSIQVVSEHLNPGRHHRRSRVRARKCYTMTLKPGSIQPWMEDRGYLLFILDDAELEHQKDCEELVPLDKPPPKSESLLCVGANSNLPLPSIFSFSGNTRLRRSARGSWCRDGESLS